MTEQGPQDRTKDKKPLKHTLLQHKDWTRHRAYIHRQPR